MAEAPLTFTRESLSYYSPTIPPIISFHRNCSRPHRVQYVSLIPSPLSPTDHRSTVEVAIHTILYVRQIYPAELFIRRKKYDTPVFQSRHPALNDYISGAVKAIGEELILVSSH